MARAVRSRPSLVRSLIVGVGATGARAARHLASQPDASGLTVVDLDAEKAAKVGESLGPPAVAAVLEGLRLETRLERFRHLCIDHDVVVLTNSFDHVAMTEVALKSGAHVVSAVDDSAIVDSLRTLDNVAKAVNKSLVIGATFAPGLSCLLSLHAALPMGSVDEIHIGKFGTGGPACARQHHKALRSDSTDWRNGQWEARRGGSGRELYWFPDPVGGLDCYHAQVPDVGLLLPRFPDLVRASAKVAATRRDRLTKRLPMLRRPHPEGLIGAIRVEVRGWNDGVRCATVYGALDRPAVAAGTVAATAALWAHRGGYRQAGAGGLAELIDDPMEMLAHLADYGIRAAVFQGTTGDLHSIESVNPQ